MIRRALLALGAALLLFRLGSPALWQDEAETALRAVSVLESGLPRMVVEGSLVTTQPSLAKFEGNESGVWIWNTWLQAYAAAASVAALGRAPFAARLPFALAGLLTIWLLPRLFEEEKAPWAAEAGQLLIVLSPAFLLFSRQCRYYALTALGAALVMLAWRRLLAGRTYAVAALVLSLQFLLHSSAAYFAVAVLVLGAEVALERRRLRDVAVAAAWTAALTLPAIWYFRLWERPGNHMYGLGEGLEFLKTFLLWISMFALPALLPAAAAWKKRERGAVAAGAVLLCGLAAEGAVSKACAAGALAWLLAEGARAKGMTRLALLWIGFSLAALSLTAGEPYGRYLMGAFPAFAFLGGLWISRLADGRKAPALALAAALAVLNLPAFALPSEPAPSVSGMMRARLRDLRPRSDFFRYLAELARGPRGYIEPAAAAIKAGGGGTVFSDSDQLSLMFAAGVKPVYKDELASSKPDWLLLSPWLRLDGQALLAVSALSPGYEPVAVSGPVLLWQNNPDPLYRDFSPKEGPLPLYRRRK